MNDDVRGRSGDEPGASTDVSHVRGRVEATAPGEAVGVVQGGEAVPAAGESGALGRSRDESAAPGETGALVRLRLDIAYDGTAFAGWAFQPGQRTVAAEIWRAMEALFGDPAGLTVAGRTDAGVHATGQVAHVDVPAYRWAKYCDRPLWRLRGILPPDVRITAIGEVPFAFDARFSALSRRYVYRIADTVWGVNPLRRLDTVSWPRPVDLDAMNTAAGTLLGEHDFAAFCKRREGATTVRALRTVRWDRDADGIASVTVVADAFCHSMVRSLVGAMLAIGEGRRDAAWLAALLTRRERSGDVLVAPANGLTLAEVEYPSEASDWAARQTETRRRRTLDEAR